MERETARDNDDRDLGIDDRNFPDDSDLPMIYRRFIADLMLIYCQSIEEVFFLREKKSFCPRSWLSLHTLTFFASQFCCDAFALRRICVCKFDSRKSFAIANYLRRRNSFAKSQIICVVATQLRRFNMSQMCCDF